jgi:cytidylate kinase
LNNLVIAIDGPAGSGKSTTARLVAERLGLLHIDTGAMYRAVTVAVLERGLDPDDEEGIARLMDTTRIELRRDQGSGIQVVLNGNDITERIRDGDVTRSVSAVSRLRHVREAMVREQRSLAQGQGVVLEGRDIGTVVFTDADVKFFLVASLEARARRRHAELGVKGAGITYQDVVEEMATRDRLDSTRDASPLRAADDAIRIDTSNLTIEQQVAIVVETARVAIAGKMKE